VKNMASQTRSEQIYARVKPELYEEFSSWADKLGLTLSQFGNLCIQAGMRQIVRSVYPEKALTTEQWAQVFAVMGEKGEIDREKMLEVLEK
jgi:hypothetical protein